MAHKGNGTGKAVGVGLVMAGLGVAAGMLLAPKSGKETRADISRKSKSVQNRARGAAKEFKNRAKDTAASTKVKVNQASEKAQSSLRRTKEDANQAVQEAKASARR